MFLSFRRNHPLAYSLCTFALLIILLGLSYAGLFGPPGKEGEHEEFLVTPEETLEDVSHALAARGLIGNTFGFSIAYAIRHGSVELTPGGYEIAPNMDAWTVATILSEPPRLAWIRVPDGYRKEQTAELFARALGWTEEEKQQWITRDTVIGEDVVEGVYFPDIYLIPSDQSTTEVAERMRARFAHMTKDLRDEAIEKGINWNEALVIASLIQREADGAHDMPLIAGVIWNRLEIDMPLGIDATLQYIRGEPTKWWPVPQSEDKYLESPYNTYFRPGLPPHPIANPSVEAIVAVLNPEETECYYYLHDYDGDIHCASSYNAHRANIDRYLR
ncbi:endolytic transglycosylase MltG [Patescibacteria group bacterium]|nr:endolytic transglycosylase MltG [Patescibacteria group bacterium]